MENFESHSGMKMFLDSSHQDAQCWQINHFSTNEKEIFTGVQNHFALFFLFFFFKKANVITSNIISGSGISRRSKFFCPHFDIEKITLSPLNFGSGKISSRPEIMGLNLSSKMRSNIFAKFSSHKTEFVYEGNRRKLVKEMKIME